jgi:transposase
MLGRSEGGTGGRHGKPNSKPTHRVQSTACSKAVVETAVQVVERWVLAVLRHHVFTSLAALNELIAEQVQRLNDRPFRKREGSRRSLFETLDKPALRPLPPTPYVFAEWRAATVHVDHHVEIDHNYYSAPYQLVGERLDVRLSASTVELLHKGRRVASHVRVYGKGHYVTEPSHRPPSHQAYLAWSPERFIRWAGEIGPNTARLVETILAERPHPELGYRACFGVLRLSKEYPRERVEAAAARALAFHVHTVRSVRSILERGLDRVAVLPVHEAAMETSHPNVRGAAYFSTGGREGRC